MKLYVDITFSELREILRRFNYICGFIEPYGDMECYNPETEGEIKIIYDGNAMEIIFTNYDDFLKIKKILLNRG